MKKLFLILICLFIGLNADAKQIKFALVSDANFSANEENNSQVLDWGIQSLNTKKLDFIVFLGNNLKKSDDENVAGFFSKTKKLKTPYYIVVGNQDSHKIGGINREDYWKKVRKNNKYNKKSSKSYYSFEINSEFMGVVLDGAVPFIQNQHGIYPEEQLAWLDKFLSKNQNKKVIIFQHFPVIDPIENYNLSTLEKEKYLEILNKYNNVAIISSGHFDISKTTIDKNGVYHISAPKLITPDYKYNIVEVDYKKLPFKKLKIEDIKVDTVDLQ